MNKIGSVQTLSDYLDAEIAWRKQELTTVRFSIARAREHQQGVALRSGICLLYAHWEGFIKKAAIAYLNYVHHQGVPYKDLIISLTAICLRSKFRSAEGANKVLLYTDLITFLNKLEGTAVIPWDEAIDARDNLRADVLEEILHITGIDPTPYSTKGPIIDERLCNTRNTIAHGDRIDVEESVYFDLSRDIIDLIDRFKNDIVNAAAQKLFRRLPNTTTPL